MGGMLPMTCAFGLLKHSTNIQGKGSECVTGVSLQLHGPFEFEF